MKGWVSDENLVLSAEFFILGEGRLAIIQTKGWPYNSDEGLALQFKQRVALHFLGNVGGGDLNSTEVLG